MEDSCKHQRSSVYSWSEQSVLEPKSKFSPGYWLFVNGLTIAGSILVAGPRILFQAAIVPELAIIGDLLDNGSIDMKRIP